MPKMEDIEQAVAVELHEFRKIFLLLYKDEDKYLEDFGCSDCYVSLGI